MLFPPALVFPPGPPFPRRPLSSRNSARGETHLGGNSTAFFTLRRSAALRVPATTPPRSPRCATAPRGRARWSGRHRLSPFRASTRCRPSVERRRSSRACVCKCSPQSRLHRSPYSFAAACRCRRRRRHRHTAAHHRENPGPVFPLRKRSLTLSPIAVTKTCEAVFAPAPGRASRAPGTSTFATWTRPPRPAGSGPKAGNRALRPRTWKTTRCVRPGRANVTRPLS